MPRTQAAVQYTCDVCGQAVDEAAIISYKVVCMMPGTGASSFEAPQVYACAAPGHALQAASSALALLEAQRVATAGGAADAQAT